MRNSIISIGFLQKIRKILPLVFGLLLFVGTVQAEMVDTFQFQNEADRVRAISLLVRCDVCNVRTKIWSNPMRRRLTICELKCMKW